MYLPKKVRPSKKEHPGLEEYLHAVCSGTVDTTLLRTWWRIVGKGEIELQTGLKILQCDRCGLVCFACKSTSVYIEAFQVCDLCLPAYDFCRPCATLILKEEFGNPTHQHENPTNWDLVMLDNEENQLVAPWNQDIMEVRQRNFFAASEEKFCTHRRYFGVELEVEKVKAGPSKLDARVINTINKSFFLVKHDGSLSNKGLGGFEIVTMPATLKFHQAGIWDTFFQYCAPFFEPAPPTASLHIHFGTDSVTEGVLGKFGQFINDPNNTEFLANIAHRELGIANPNGKVYMRLYPNQKAPSILKLKVHFPDCPWHPKNIRTNNRYELLKDKSIKKDGHGHPIIASLKGSDIIVRPTCKCRDGHYLVEDHYSAFNLHTRRPTAELRIFRGVVKRDFLFAALEFTEALIDFCTNMPPAELNYQKFLSWHEPQRRTYPYLSKLLVVRGWLEPPKSRRNLESGRNMTYTNVYSFDNK
jgi:hypothetical protein